MAGSVYLPNHSTYCSSTGAELSVVAEIVQVEPAVTESKDQQQKQLQQQQACIKKAQQQQQDNNGMSSCKLISLLKYWWKVEKLHTKVQF